MSNPGDTAVESDAAERRNWARGVFEMPDGVESRAHLLRTLADQDFVLYGFQREAADVLRGHVQPSLPGSTDVSAFEAARSQSVSQEIDSLAADFFSLPVEVRRGRWTDLRQRRQLTPPQRLRLDALHPGLEVVVPPTTASTGSRLSELIAVVCELFVLAPIARAESRAAFLKRVDRDPAAWCEAAAKLSRGDFAVGRLLPGFLEELPELVKTKRISRPQLPTWQEVRFPTWQEEVAARTPQLILSPPHDRRKSGGISWVWVSFAVFGSIAMIRGCLSEPKPPNLVKPPQYRFDPSQLEIQIPRDEKTPEFERFFDPGRVDRLQQRHDAERERLRKLLRDSGVNPDSRRRLEREMEERQRREREEKTGGKSSGRTDADDSYRRAAEATRILLGKPAKSETKKTRDP